MLNEVLLNLSEADRNQITDNLQLLANDSATGYQAVENFYAESRLGASAWALWAVALRSNTFSTHEIKATITGINRTVQLTGTLVQGAHSIVFCRAITIARLSRLLVSLNYYGSVQSATRAVRNALYKPVTVLTSRWKDVDLGRFVQWSTFEPGGGRTFDGVNSADYIQGVLGLDRAERGGSVILLEYTLPADVPPRFPTVADAYSGPCWPYFFRVAPLRALYGLTMPWPEYQAEPPRPEVVHEVITGRQLSRIREVVS